MGLIIIIVFISILSPILGGSMAIISLKFFFKSKNIYFIFFILGGVLGFLNSLKLPESDLINYIVSYKLAINLSLAEFLILKDKEYIFQLLTYIISHFTNGNVTLYLVILSSISYGIFLSSIYGLSRFWKTSYNSFILAVIIALLFPNLFTLSAHLIRQFIAGSLVCLYFTILVREQYKYAFFVLLLAGSIHSSAFLFFYLFLFIDNGNQLNIKKQIIKFSILVFILFGLVSFQNTLINLPILGYAFGRFFNRENAIWETDNLGFLSIFLILFIVLFNGFVIYLFKEKKNIILFFIWPLILVLFILMNYNNTEIALRFTFYIYFIFPIIFIFFYEVLKINIKLASLLNMLLFILLFYYFVYKINNGTWTYLNLENMFITI